MRFDILTALLIADAVAAHAIDRARNPASNKAAANGKAVYLLTNDAQNAVVALPIGADGKLSTGSVTASGGKGSNSIDGTTKQPAKPDALVSQSALSIVGQNVFVVNAGSNTLSMFAIDSSDPTKLSLVGQPVAVPAEFPNTVAASMKNKMVCVGSTGATAGISCSSFSSKGLGAMGSLIPIDLGQTTPPVGPTNTVSQVLFSQGESSLLTTVKGDPASNKTGFLSVLPISSKAHCKGGAKAAKQDIRSTPQGTAVLFGTTIIPGTSNVFATDASFGGAVLAVDPKTNTATTVARQAIDGQKATCWATFSDVTKTVFVTDVATPRIVEMSATDAKIVSQTNLAGSGQDGGFIDLKAAGNFLYALDPGNGTSDAAISVLDISGGPGSAKLVQRFGLAGVAGANAQGLQILA